MEKIERMEKIRKESIQKYLKKYLRRNSILVICGIQ